MNKCEFCDNTRTGSIYKYGKDLVELQGKYEKLLSIVKSVVRALDHIEIQPSSAIHHCARNLLRELNEYEGVGNE